ncbi:MAG: hypothetical protein WBQ94_17400 [Terracidiphilus sp.]
MFEGQQSTLHSSQIREGRGSWLLLNEAKVAVSPGIGFGDYGDGHVRFSLIENEERTRQALRGIKHMLAKGEMPAVKADLAAPRVG